MVGGADRCRKKDGGKPRPMLRSYEPNLAAHTTHLPGGHFSSFWESGMRRENRGGGA